MRLKNLFVAALSVTASQQTMAQDFVRDSAQDSMRDSVRDSARKAQPGLFLDGDHAAPLQLRLIDGACRTAVAEVDVASDVLAAFLLVSAEQGSIQLQPWMPRLLITTLALPMQRRNALTCVTDLDFGAVADGTCLFLQTVVVGANLRVYASRIARWDIGDAPNVGKSLYEGPPITISRYAQAGSCGVLGSNGVELSVTVPSNDWALLHQMTHQTADGTDLWVILESPGEGEGMLDVVETHTLSIDVGPRLLDGLRIFVARSRGEPANVRELEFHRLGRPDEARDVGAGAAPSHDRGIDAVRDRYGPVIGVVGG